MHPARKRCAAVRSLTPVDDLAIEPLRARKRSAAHAAMPLKYGTDGLGQVIENVRSDTARRHSSV